MRSLIGLIVMGLFLPMAWADTPTEKDSGPRARVTMVIPTPLKKHLGASIIRGDVKTWETKPVVDIPDVAAEIKRLNTRDGKLAAPAGPWVEHVFYFGKLQDNTQVYFRETEGDRFPSLFLPVDTGRTNHFLTPRDKEAENTLAPGLALDGTLLRGKVKAISPIASRPFIKFVAICSSARPRDDKLPSPGSVMVEGIGEPGNHTFGPGKQSPLAIRNGDAPIIVTGKMVKDFSLKTQNLRVTGKLSLSDKLLPVVEAEKIEEVGEKSELEKK